MNYLIFNNTILLSDGDGVRSIEKSPNHPDHDLLSLDTASVCVVDVDVVIASAIEDPIEKKDNILVRKFKELYQHEAYVIQDEKVDTNLFQVIGIKEQKVREVYSLIPADKIETFIPYAIALRNTLVNKKVDLNKTVVFVDDLGSERLVTVFDGLKFSRTRVIANNGEDILPEIKRSQIDFFKKNEEYLSKKGSDFVIIVNSQVLSTEISKNNEKIPVNYLGVKYPAIEGLKEPNAQIKYVLPEEVLKKRRELELKKNFSTMTVSLCVVAAGLFYFLFNKIEFGLLANQCDVDTQANDQLDKKLTQLDKETYREDLRKNKSLNYGISYLTVLNLIPPSYEVSAFKFIKSGKWNLELTLSSDNSAPFDQIPKVKILKEAQIKDIFINSQPGKHLRITL
jgi:hypothetical protein